MKKLIFWIWLIIFGGSLISFIVTLIMIFKELFAHPFDAVIPSNVAWTCGISIVIFLASVIIAPMVEAMEMDYPPNLKG